MFKYELYIGYKRKTKGYPLLGEIEYPYSLSRGELVVLSGDLFDKLESVTSVTERPDLKATQAWRIAEIHHFVDSANHSVPSVYLVNESDYLNKYKD
ncbi:hypothetical protein [Lysinibacillus sphaericus]|uniref:hypothetical protein n=1 Tax=Lysinibacillus sphaericus TaxID=1421 RepID=UPI003D7FB97E